MGLMKIFGLGFRFWGVGFRETLNPKYFQHVCQDLQGHAGGSISDWDIIWPIMCDLT